MFVLAQAAVTKYHWLGYVNKGNVFLTVPESGSPRAKTLAWLGLGRALFRVVEGCHHSLCPHGRQGHRESKKEKFVSLPFL